MNPPPPKPKKPMLIDVQDTDQVIRLGLGALFTLAAIARGARNDLQQVADSMIVCADALMDAAARQRDP